MRATYKVIDFDELIPKPVYTEKVYKHGSIEDTVKKMQELSVKYIKAMTQLARHLQDGTDIQTFFNLFHFVKSYIKYEYDTFGKEVLRSPLRTWQEKKGDCDCMSIFMASVLLSLGYEPYFVLIKTHGNKNFSHVYVEVNGISLDPVIDQNNLLPFEKTFNKVPNNISAIKKVKVMDIVTLEGIDCIHGLEAVLPPDRTTLYLMKVQSQLIESSGNPKELRKIRYLILLNGSDARDVVLKLMPYIDDVRNGELIFKPGTDMNFISYMIEQLEGETLEGKKRKGGKFNKWKNKVKDKVKDLKNKVKDKVKNFGKNFVKYNPATIAARNGLLLALKINAFGISSKLIYGYVPHHEAVRRKFNMSAWQRAVDKKNAVEKLFEKLGGDKNKLKNAVTEGKAKRKTKLNIKGMNGLGAVDPVTISAIAAAAPVVIQVIKMLKDVKQKDIDPKNTEGVDPTGEEDGGIPDIPQSSDIPYNQGGQNKPIPYNQGGQSKPRPAINDGYSNDKEKEKADKLLSEDGGEPQENKSNTSKMFLIGGAALALGFLLLNKK